MMDAKTRPLIWPIQSLAAASIWLCLGLLPPGVAGAESEAGASAGTIEELALVLSTLFPSMAGTAVAVVNDGSRIEVDRGSAQGLRPGLILTVYRSGEPLLHPLTGVVIATSETELGRAVIERVEAERAVARLLPSEDTPPVQAGDRVRLTAGRLPVALVSAASGSPVVVNRFLVALEETGRFQVKLVTPSEPVVSFVGQSSDEPVSLPATRLTALASEARAQGADYLFLFDIQLRKGLTIGAVAIAEAASGQSVDAVQTPLRLRVDGLPAEADDALLQALASREGRVFREARFSYRAEHAVIGDLDRDGFDELVVSDGWRVRVYSMHGGVPGPTAGPATTLLNPALLAEESVDRPGRRQLALELADIHGTGRPQLFVTAMIEDQRDSTKNRLDSYVLDWQEGGLKQVAEHQPYYFRVLSPSGRAPVLLAQQHSPHHPFYGDVVRLHWTGRAYEEQGAITLPPAVALYDFTIADLDGDGREELLYLDQQDFLVVATTAGERLGKSQERFGGVASFFDYIPAGVSQGGESSPDRARVLGRMVVIDLDGDGAVEIVVPKNVPLTRMIERVKGYRYGQIYVLGWDGRQFVEKWTIPRVEGIIADVGVARLLGGDAGLQLLVLANPTFTDKGIKDFFTSSSQLLLYAVPQG